MTPFHQFKTIIKIYLYQDNPVQKLKSLINFMKTLRKKFRSKQQLKNPK